MIGLFLICFVVVVHSQSGSVHQQVGIFAHGDGRQFCVCIADSNLSLNSTVYLIGTKQPQTLMVAKINDCGNSDGPCGNLQIENPDRCYRYCATVQGEFSRIEFGVVVANPRIPPESDSGLVICQIGSDTTSLYFTQTETGHTLCFTANKLHLRGKSYPWKECVNLPYYEDSVDTTDWNEQLP